MNKSKVVDLIKVIGVTVLVVILLFGLYFKNSNNKDLLEVCFKDSCFGVQENLNVSAWNGLDVLVDDKEYDEYPTIYGDITIGSDAKDVFEKFDIKTGYAYINMEVPGGDGTTDVKTFEYENLEFLDMRYLDALIIFGYKKENGNYVMVEASQIEEYYYEDDYEGIDVLFTIDINGMSDEDVDVEKVISFEIEVLN